MYLILLQIILFMILAFLTACAATPAPIPDPDKIADSDTDKLSAALGALPSDPTVAGDGESRSVVEHNTLQERQQHRRVVSRLAAIR